MAVPNLRSFLGKYRRTHSQMRYAFLFLGATLCTIGGMIALLIAQISSVISALESAEKIDREAAGIIRETLIGSSIFFVGVSVLVSVASFLYGARIANRIFGPMIPIKRFIQKLKVGEYSDRLQLRKDDEFTDIADELNALAQALTQTSGQKSGQPGTR